jgi:hypothetical protein
MSALAGLVFLGTLAVSAQGQDRTQPDGAVLPVRWEPDVARLPENVAKLYGVVKPRPEEVKWRKIPWLVDLNEGIRIAKDEKRPLLIYVSQQSHPLERN